MNNINNPKIKERSGSIFIAFFRGINLGFTNFWRNKYLSFATIIVMAVIIFIFNVILAINFMGNQSLQSLSQKIDLSIELKDEINFYEVSMLIEAINQINGVKQVKYTSKEEALEIVGKTHPQTADFLRKFDLKNPLPPSLSIVTENPEDHKKIQELLAKPEYKIYTNNLDLEGTSGESIVLASVAKNLQNISWFVRQIIFWIIFVFIIGGTLIIINAIQLTIYSRQQEIHIMKLVGATPGFIRLPFIFEGILYSVLAVIISFVILYLIGQGLNIGNIEFWTLYNDIAIWRVFIYELAITIILATISSFSAVEQHIQSKLQLN
jgi:cell division transport system permease protein